ncbi:MAG: hypothetical protein JSS98_17525 [Bacteroidetes bacterium]|nr:hypothetical protein [Bacteroidota bacterium]
MQKLSGEEKNILLKKNEIILLPSSTNIRDAVKPRFRKEIKKSYSRADLWDMYRRRRPFVSRRYY